MKIKSFFSDLIHKQHFRWYVSAGVSLLAGIAFSVYNFYVGVAFNLVWNFSVSFYYLILTVIKSIILYFENKWKKYPENEIHKNRLWLFLIENVFLFIIDLLLIAPIVLLFLQKRDASNIGMIPAIAVAAYTTYRIVMACINYKKSEKSKNLSLHGLKIIDLKEAIASIITLQNTMVSVFGDADEMLTLTATTTAGMFLSLIIISAYQVNKIKRLKE